MNQMPFSYASIASKNQVDQRPTFMKKGDNPLLDLSGFAFKSDTNIFDGSFTVEKRSDNITSMITNSIDDTTHLYMMNNIDNTFRHCYSDSKSKTFHNISSFADDYYENIKEQIINAKKNKVRNDVRYYKNNSGKKRLMYKNRLMSGISGMGIQPHSGNFAFAFNNRTNDGSIVRMTQKTQYENQYIYKDIGGVIFVDSYIYCMSFNSDGGYILSTSNTKPEYNGKLKLYDAASRHVCDTPTDGIVGHAGSLYGSSYCFMANDENTSLIRYDPRSKSYEKLVDLNVSSNINSSLSIMSNGDILLSSMNHVFIYHTKTKTIDRYLAKSSDHWSLMLLATDNFDNIYALYKKRIIFYSDAGHYYFLEKNKDLSCLCVDYDV